MKNVENIGLYQLFIGVKTVRRFLIEVIALKYQILAFLNFPCYHKNETDRNFKLLK